MEMNIIKRKNKIILGFFSLLLFINVLLLLTNIWIYNSFGDIKIQKILFTILSPTNGTDSTVIYSYILKVFLFSIVLIIVNFLILFLHKRVKSIHFSFLKICGFLFLIITLIFNAVYTNYHNGITDYFNYKSQSTYIYNNKPIKKKTTKSIGDDSIIYQNPQDITISILNDTNNLIYIYLESIENTFMDIESGGIKSTNCMPKLTRLANENISFSNTDKLGGALPFTGTTWTIASMTAQLIGLPLKVDVASDLGQQNNFMLGAKALGDYLHEHGYVHANNDRIAKRVCRNE